MKTLINKIFNNLIINKKGLPMIENLSINEFSQLPNRMKHELTEEVLGDKIKLTYAKAIDTFNSCLELNETLATSYENFKILCNESQLNLINDLDILLNVSIDKFNQELYFTIKNKENIFSHYVFNIPDSKFTLISDKMDLRYTDSSGRAVCKSDSSYSDIRYVRFKLKFERIFSKNLRYNIKELWTKELNHHIYNRNCYDILILNGINNEETDINYLWKNFRPIAYNMVEYDKHELTRNISSPAYTCLEPDDLITHFSNVKNARSQI